MLASFPDLSICVEIEQRWQPVLYAVPLKYTSRGEGVSSSPQLYGLFLEGF